MSDFTDKLEALIAAAYYHELVALDDDRAAVVSLFDAERARAEAAEKERDGLLFGRNTCESADAEFICLNRLQLEQERDAARAELAELHSEFRQQNSDFGAALIALDDKRAELARVRANLVRYAMHDRKCEGLDWETRTELMGKCTCGLEAALMGEQ